MEGMIPVTTAILGLNMYETALAGIPYFFFLFIGVAVVLAAILLFRMYKALESIKEMQEEQNIRLRSIDAALSNMTGSSNESNQFNR